MLLRRLLLWLVLLGSLCLALLFVLVPRPGHNALPAANSVRWCQCVDYVRQRFGLDPAAGPHFVGAADMGPYLQGQGMVRHAAPLLGAVIVFPRSFGSGIDTTYGHVGVVVGIEAQADHWRLTVRGARQSWPEWTEYGCSNVSDMTHITVPYQGATVAFFAPSAVQPVSESRPVTAQPVSTPTSEPTAIATSTPAVPTPAAPTPKPMPTASRGPHLAASPAPAVPTASPAPAPAELPALLTQWSSEEQLAPGSYRFRAWGGPGMRLYLDGELVLDGVSTPATYYAERSVSGGPHQVRVEVYATSNGSQARFTWEQQHE